MAAFACFPVFSTQHLQCSQHMSGLVLGSRVAEWISPYPQRKYCLLRVRGQAHKDIITIYLWGHWLRGNEFTLISGGGLKGRRNQREITFSCYYINELLSFTDRRERMQMLVKRGRHHRQREQREHAQGGMEISLQAPSPILPATQSMTWPRVQKLSVSSRVRLHRFTASLLHRLTCSVLGRLYKPSVT